jgi:PEGA domain-containing protein
MIASACSLSFEGPVSSHKRLIVTLALALAAIGGVASTVRAQPYYRGHGHGHVVVSGGFYYSPFWYGGFYDPWFAPYPYWGYPYPPYPGPYLPPEASLKLEVKPNSAEVYVDGFYAGIVDDFDGAFQRLHVPPGQHELELYLDGYRAVKQQVHLTADKTFKVKYTMEKLGPGEQAEPRPQPPAPPPNAQGTPPMMQPPPGYPPQQPTAGYPPQPPPAQRAPGRTPPPPPTYSPRVEQGAYGTLAIRVQPSDAEVSIDGEPWHSPGGQERLTVEVAEGSHTVEIRKTGYRTYVTQIDVRRGTTTPLNVSLRGEQ